MIGKTLSHYKVLEKIGQGGMGEVYRAEDTNLSREVAIKVLPEQFTKDPQRLARFEREAKLLASLNHPNIAAIHSFEHSDDIHFLVLELVPGETLQERVAKGPLPVEEALEVCRQIAEGVEAAHEKGVIHRDLKPANVKVTPEGKVKILDFGLAKAFEEETPAADISQSPTLTEEMTRAGVILGTAAYMSPEQAKGKEVDRRADIFAFGAVLYELLTGKRAFGGETITETLASILKSEPDWEQLPGDTPWNIRTLLRRCLHKETNRRFQHVGDVRIEIEEALTEPVTVSPIGITGAAKPSRWRPLTIVSLVILAAVTTTVAIWILVMRSPQVLAPGPVTHFVVTPPATAPIGGGTLPDLAISPDGRRIVYIADGEAGQLLYVRRMDEVTVLPIPGTEGARNPLFSPDGDSVAFYSRGRLMRVSLGGGTVVKLCDVPIFNGGHWGSVDTIVFAGDLGSGRGLYRVPANGGQPESLALPDPDKGEDAYVWPWILPGGNEVLFTVLLEGGSFQLAVVSIQTNKQKILLEGVRAPRYAPTGHLLYETGTRTLMAVPFDLATLEVSGDPIPILQEIRPYDYSFSADGTLIYVPGGARAVVGTPVLVDRDGGNVEPIVKDLLEMPRFPSLSPDGGRLVLTTGPDGDGDLWVYDLSGRPPYRLTTEGHNTHAVWTPDGKRVAFASSADIYTERPWSLFWIPADGSTLHAEPLLPPSPNFPGSFPGSWSPDGRELVFVDDNANEIIVLPIEGEGSPNAEAQYRISDNVSTRVARLSPNGKLVAYVSSVTGRQEIWVLPYSGTGAPIRISPNGGLEPIWSPDSRELFYLQGNKMMTVKIGADSEFRFERPEVLFEGNYYHDYNPSYDVGPDGRFLMIQRGDQEPGQAQIHVVLNWFEELKRLVPTP